jgi:ferritin-like metal-binding protein YciE/DNA-binding transcriptional MerR regulator
LAKSARDRKLQAAFEKHHTETETHVSHRCLAQNRAIDAKPHGKTCDAIMGMVEEGQEIMKEYKGSPALDAGLLAAAQAAEDYEISRYGTLRTWAEELGLSDATKLLEAILHRRAMTSKTEGDPGEISLGIGFYTVPEAARLLRVSPLSIRRWLGGYTFIEKGKEIRMPPLWKPQLPAYEHHLELGFRDLIELRFVKAFLEAGLGLRTIRSCLEYARDCVNDERPFSTRRFQTDGRTIFLESLHLHRTVESELLDLRKRQYVLKQIIERTLPHRKTCSTSVHPESASSVR